ncbi:hypothetical protein DCAR_0832517 [Daucus carota subsp. sativus]|uniref:Dihydrolipoamide acetyltransferase component of pyruvate dehydrogenase complex n=1 Tax=Daucus carota subsp. sativus TaxID=79200 RepID=A0AAF0XRN7_DAUCS|nr:hypothetical protein DCAR_0832517 [Daucus carota subsp. sativus]
MLSRRIFRTRPWSSAGWRGLVHDRTAAKSSPPVTGTARQSWLFSARDFKSMPSCSVHKFYEAKNPYGIQGCSFSSQPMVEVRVDGIVEIPLAQTGEGIAECELLKWFVQPGDKIDEFQPLCEVQSDKATIEITSRYKGEVSEILHVPGDIVKVGETLLKLFVSELSVPAEVGDTMEPDNDTCTSDIQETAKGGVLSTPAVRNIAKMYNINLQDVSGTGKDGRVLKEDVLKYAASKGLIGDIPSPITGDPVKQKSEREDIHQDDYEDKTYPLRGFHRAMVKTMTAAAKIPHFYFVEEINCDALVDLKAFFQKHSDPDVKHTSLPILIKSLSMALKKYPLLNSRFSEESNEVTLRGSHNIGIAMATPSGLVVPNIKKVQSLSILEITKELSRLRDLAMANKLSQDDISGGTITLSNIGSIGGKFGSPLINAPEVAIIAIGQLQKLPRYDDKGNVYPAAVTTVNIAADHRVLDGATVAYFCKEWKSFIEKPELYMLHMR